MKTTSWKRPAAPGSPATFWALAPSGDNALGWQNGPFAVPAPESVTARPQPSQSVRYSGNAVHGNSDTVAFNSACRQVDATSDEGDLTAPSRNEFFTLVGRLGPPYGGTEIGKALEASEQSGNRDVLLITDGLSYELDVLGHARSGRRVFVILVGEDSLEAKVGHLAALTGGGVFYSFGGDVRRAVMAALPRLRNHRERPQVEDPHSDWPPGTIRIVRGGAAIEVRWGESRDARRAEPLARSVAAFSAGITLPRLAEDAAERLAVGQGIVTHLSSLVLVDDDGKVQDLLPVFEKVRLPVPRTQAGRGSLPGLRYSISSLPPPRPAPDSAKTPYEEDGTAGEEWPWLEQPESEVGAWLKATGRMVNWTKHSSDLEAGRLEALPLRFAMMIRILVRLPLVRRCAAKWDLAPAQAAVALVALAVADRSKAAGIVRDSLIGTPSERQVSGAWSAIRALRRTEIESLLEAPANPVR